ncbi:tyrosine-protein kinase YwqD [Microcystis aeruginosa NIES-2520]|jgi:succinoglycan biosynthesis transport protein ExoP|uniref:non-specific protein-tyrosine kinase n=1 Tax=Microcystis aeruginosa NIES-2520 TaxID=2303982 RepID=A0A5A5RGV0_MICAE|nr:MULTISPECIES: polysaccharide biosynthesis tyrosine autokinase [Microcystis]MCA2667246.1 polysaccharide biosynthesis tyrosine autokinase [Microcystis sp. M045S2]MCA2712181.1 polysaccharide biosynthesis tyrosine autokinase [Microcystis sp. M172S2]MCA2803893.1 polysaccharide biosynthesis tyrosine autokinase [Microcystis sp. M114S2]MCA2834694.1 polysaccharide biosynthesis tyrosine autokinase [Microcystis sp. M007S1]MCA2836606.1 polysaccharide biosynthesis tyrosine autokinase [Microcystis sp. M0
MMNNQQNGALNNQQNGALKTHNQANLPIFAQPAFIPSLTQEEEELNLRQVFSVFKHRRWLIAGITLGVTGAIATWTFLKTPIYQGRFLLLIGQPIEENKNSLRLAAQDILPQLGGEDIDYDTQIAVLTSPQLLNPILSKITPKYPDFTYSDLISKTGQSDLEISQLKETKVLEISYQDAEPEKIKLVLDNLARHYLNYSSQERKTEINQGLDFVNAQLPLLRERVNTLQKQMQQFRQQYNFLDPDKEATRLSQQLTTTEQDYRAAQVALNEINSRYQALQQQVGLAPNQAIIATYLSESPGYQDLLKQLQEVEVELAKQSAVFAKDSPIIATLEEKRANLLPLLQNEAQRTLGEKLPQTVGNSPALVSRSALRVELTQQLVEAANSRQTLEIKVESLARSLEQQKASVKNLAVLARRYTDLQRELEIATTSLGRFLEEQQKLQLKVAQQVVPWQLISPPEVEEEFVSPKPVRNLALGVIGGLLLGIGAAFLAERLDPVHHSADELKEDAKLPLLGAIPWNKDIDKIEKVNTALPQLTVGDRKITIPNSTPKSANENPYYYNFSPFSEAFHTLNTNIRLLGSDSPLKSLVISSVSPGDGKTTMAINIAKAAARMGQKVLLVDADLRRPQIHLRLNLDNDHGLSNVLAEGLDWNEAVQSLPRHENLSILTAGSIPPDPTRLLSSQRMQEMISQLQQDHAFDLIIYDLPPIAAFADAKILAAMATGLILVTKLGKTDRFALKNLLEDLKLSHISVLGLVANNVSRKDHNYRYYGHYYGKR